MPRHKRIRRIASPPRFKGFTPIGLPESKQVMVLDYEEYEAIRLCDFDAYNHLEASRIMNVSRPTFARIYDSARQKVAYAFVQGLPIIFEGGKVYFDSEWMRCADCGCKFNHLDVTIPARKCALCGSEKISPVTEEAELTDPGHTCLCPSCGQEKQIPRGVPCSHMVCDRCHTRMRRRRHPAT